MLAFFLSGLPGGLDYAMLAMVKHGYLSIEAEKRYNARVMVRTRVSSLSSRASIVMFSLRSTGLDPCAWLHVVRIHNLLFLALPYGSHTKS
jgi:hypothetical protein